MAIASADILIKYSATLASGGNQLAGSPTYALGKYISTSSVGALKNDLLDDVTGAENAASTVDYRCVFVHNNHATLTYTFPKVYVSAEVAGGTTVALAVDSMPYTTIDYSTIPQADTIVSDTSTPLSVGAFSSPTTSATGIELSDIPAGCCRAVWVRRSAADSAEQLSDGFTLGVWGVSP